MKGKGEMGNRKRWGELSRDAALTPGERKNYAGRVSDYGVTLRRSCPGLGLLSLLPSKYCSLDKSALGRNSQGLGPPPCSVIRTLERPRTGSLRWT